MNKKKFCVVKKDQPQDPSWYLENDNAARDAAQLGYTNATGEIDDCFGANIQTVPGMMAIYWAPAIGDYYASSMSDGWKTNPFNIAEAKQYANMRRKNTASPVYQKTDLGVYNMCVDSLIGLHALLVRLYKTVVYFKNRNKYTARNICELHGVDYDSVADNLADFGIFINNFAKKINNALSVPNLTMFTRHYWLNSHLWKDGDSVKSQVYMYIQYAFHRYNPTKSSDGGGTDAVPLFTANSSTKLSVDALKAFANSLINSLISDDDILLISADVDKWYGGNQYFLPMIQAGETIEPEYSLEVLSQIQNTTIYDAVRLGDLYQHATGLYLSQDFGLQMVGVNNLTDYYSKKAVIAPYDAPTPEQTLVMTRNMSLVSTNTNAVVDVCTLGSEAFIGIKIKDNPRIATTTPQVNSVELYYKFSDDDAVVLAEFLMRVKSFDMCPAGRLIDDNATPVSDAVILLEYENYTKISYDRLKQIHNMALFSEFGFYQTQHLSER